MQTNGKIIESIDKKGYIWKVEIIKEGISLNNNFYPENVLKLAAERGLFEGVRAFARSDFEHLKNINESVQNVVGWFDNVKYSDERKSIEGYFHITKDAEWLRQKTLTAYESKKMDLFGFSIVGEMMIIPERINSKNVTRIVEIIKIDSIDPVVNPSAGGGLVDIVEAKNNNQYNKEQNFMENNNEKTINGHLSMNNDQSPKSNDHLSMNNGQSVSESVNDGMNKINDTLNRIAVTETRLKVNESLSKTSLPESIREKIKIFCEGKVLNETEIKNIISLEQDTYAKVMEEVKLKESVSSNKIDIGFGMDEKEKIQEALDNLFFTGIRLTDDEKKNSSKYNNAFRSIKEAYIQITGDENITGQAKNARRISENVDTSTFSNALANSITKKMVRDYNLMGLDTWRNFVDIAAISDFRQQERIRIGGYGNLSTVSQGSNYPALSSPSDERVTYSVSKYGGIETITLEAIRNDDVYALRKIPVNLARAAAQTLHEHIFNWFKNNSTIYDTKTFFHADHLNLGSTALDATSLAAARLSMKKQAQANSNKPLGLRSKYLLVPSDLEVAAYGLTRLGFGQNNNVPTFLQEQHIIPIVVDYWTDTNNWYLIADPNDATCIEVGFLDGKEEPELFVQDMPNFGSLFNNDTIIYKIRHIYSSAVIDYRAAFGSVVTG
jgi:hypothetical protein